jgi:predicted ATPase/DNA-binding XRE family transcriptional regulator
VLDLTQQELAQRVGCAVITIRKIETDGRRPSREMAQRLAEELDLRPDERDAFVKAARQDMRVERLTGPGTRPQLLAGASGPPAPATPLIGREGELETIRRLLASSRVRLLTLTGVGGAGKTRLALALAWEAPASFPDGVHVVSLASLTTSSLVLTAIAQALGIVEIAGHELADRVQAQLGDRRVLLVLDNFEHVIGAAPVVTELLQRCPNLKVLVTSRTVLRLSGEYDLPVLPLSVAEQTDVEDWESIAAGDAVRLFAERARAVHPAFTLNETVVPVVAEICRRLDGLPLAIELAAARSTLLSPRDLLARLERRLEILSGGPRDAPARQRTMRATIDWSYDLLHASEQALFRRLAVFAGSWTLRAAEAICAVEGEPTVFEMLAALVDHSLVRWEGESGGEGHFSMLDTLREYAFERLERAGEGESIRRRHVMHFLAMAEEAEAALRGPGQLVQIERLERDHNNVREALHWCLTRSQVEPSYRLIGALWRFWFLRGHFHEWDRWWTWLESLPQTQESSSFPGLRAQVLLGRAFLAHYEGDTVGAKALGEECLDLYGRLSDPRGSAISLVIAGAADRWYGSEGQAASRLELGVSRVRDAGDPWLLAWALQPLGEILGRVYGEHTRARALLEESLELARQTGDCWLTARALTGLVQVLTLQYDFRYAAALAEESLALYRTLGDRLGITWSLHELGAAAFIQGEYVTAKRIEVERLTIERQLGNVRGVWHALWSLEMVVLELDDADQVTALNEESLVLARTLGEDWRIILSLRNRALAALMRHDYEQSAATAQEAALLAEDIDYGWVRASALRALAWALHLLKAPAQPGALFRESLALERDGGSKVGVAESLAGLAAADAALGRIDSAARWYAAALRIRRSINAPQPPSERVLCAPAMEVVLATVGAQALDAMVDVTEGEQVDVVIAEALAEETERALSDSGP